MPKPRSRTKIRIAPRRANQPVLQAEHFLTPDSKRGLEGVNRRISAIEDDIASRPSIDDFKQFMIGQIAEQIKAAGSPFIHRMDAAQPTAATIFPAIETAAASGPARPVSLEQELGVIPGKPLSELTDAMQRVMAGEAAPRSDDPPASAVDDEIAMETERQKATTSIDTDWLTSAAGKLTDGLFIGIGTVIGLMLGGVGVWKIWPWIDQLVQ
jgi:hypothetical protein